MFEIITNGNIVKTNDSKKIAEYLNSLLENNHFKENCSSNDNIIFEDILNKVINLNNRVEIFENLISIRNSSYEDEIDKILRFALATFLENSNDNNSNNDQIKSLIRASSVLISWCSDSGQRFGLTDNNRIQIYIRILRDLLLPLVIINGENRFNNKFSPLDINDQSSLKYSAENFLSRTASLIYLYNSPEDEPLISRLYLLSQAQVSLLQGKYLDAASKFYALSQPLPENHNNNNNRSNSNSINNSLLNKLDLTAFTSYLGPYSSISLSEVIDPRNALILTTICVIAAPPGHVAAKSRLLSHLIQENDSYTRSILPSSLYSVLHLFASSKLVPLSSISLMLNDLFKYTHLDPNIALILSAITYKLNQKPSSSNNYFNNYNFNNNIIGQNESEQCQQEQQQKNDNLLIWSKDLNSQINTSLYSAAEGKSVIEVAILEHNVVAASNVYITISFSNLANLLGIPQHSNNKDMPDSFYETQTEELVQELICQSRLDGKIDQLTQTIYFDPNGSKTGLSQWNKNIYSFTHSTDTLANEILKEYQ